MSRERAILQDAMGPRRWALTGVAFAVVGAVRWLLRLGNRGTSASFAVIGAVVAFVAILVELALEVASFP